MPWNLIALFMIHFLGDFYCLFYSPLLPFLKDKFAMSLTMATGLTALYLGVQNFLQPVCGWISARVGWRRLVIFGLSLSALGMSFLGWAGSIPLLILALVVGAIGIASFHPCGAAFAGELAGPGRTTAMSIYMLGGHLGCMAAPLLIPILAKEDMRLIAPLAAAGLLFAGFLARRFPGTGAADVSDPRPARVPLGDIVKKLWAVHVHVALRFIPMQTFLGFLPLYGKLRGVPEQRAGWSLSAFMLAGALGVILGGALSGRFSRRTLMIASNVGAGVCLLLAPAAEGPLFYVALCAGSIFAYIVMPLQIVIAQELTPASKGIAAGVVMGFAYGNASLVLIPLGRLADLIKERSGSELSAVIWLLRVSTAAFFLAAVLCLFMKFAADKAQPHRKDDPA